MKAYFIRRLLLIPPTLVGITLLVFTVTRIDQRGRLSTTGRGRITDSVTRRERTLTILRRP